MDETEQPDEPDPQPPTDRTFSGGDVALHTGPGGKE